VKALTRFQPVLKKLSDDLDWTTDLGDAAVNQPQDVAGVIQQLRAEAEKAGALKTTPQQDGGYKRRGRTKRDHNPADRSLDRLCPDL
jgi:hypothetical protein